MTSDASAISCEVLQGEERLEPERQRVREVAHLRLFRRRHAEHLGDHPERQGEGEVGDHVELGARVMAPRHRGVEHLVDHRLHARRQPLDHPRA